MVTKMARGEKRVPLEHCPFIQEFTGGAVTCEELRPDAAEYFALIRAQGADPAATTATQTVSTAHPVTTGTWDGVERRDPNRVHPHDDLDRRKRPEEARP